MSSPAGSLDANAANMDETGATPAKDCHCGTIGALIEENKEFRPFVFQFLDAFRKLYKTNQKLAADNKRLAELTVEMVEQSTRIIEMNDALREACEERQRSDQELRESNQLLIIYTTRLLGSMARRRRQRRTWLLDD
ncbi:hypothetical protein HIM_02232 [Hirsutella minnesotensis 3608]|nr:hypothetical protein HIM_02232 [Hirsutella minnesotensis 3608]